MSAGQSTLLPALVVSACSTDAVQKVLAVPPLNALARGSIRQSCIKTGDSKNSVVEASRMIRLATINFSLQLLLPSKFVSLVAGILPEVEVEEPKIEEPFAKRARSCSTAHPVALVSYSTLSTDRLLVISNYVGHMVVAIQLAGTEEKVRGYMYAKLKKIRRK